MIDVINPSITAGIGTQNAINPLAMVGQFAQTQNALNQNALFQQTFRARQALGPLAQQAMGQDGQMDWAKYGVLVSTHPDTAFMAPEILNQIAQKKLVDAETMNAELVGYEKRMGITSQLAAVAAKNPDIKKGSDLTNLASDMLAAGGIKDGNRKDLVSWLTQMSSLPDAEVKPRLAQFAQTHEPGRKALSDINGQYNPSLYYNTQTGDKMGGWVSTVTGRAAPAGGFGAAPSAQPGAVQPPGAGGANLQLGEMGPLRSDLIGKQGEYQKNMNDEAAISAKSDQMLNELDSALKGVKTGGGSEHYMQAAKLMQAFGVSDKYVDQVANGDLSNLQEAQKLMLMVATGSLRSALLPGAGRLTNTEFNAFREANPNIDLDPRAIQKLINFQRQVNGLSQKKAQAYALAYGSAVRGEKMPANLQDITQFEPYWISKLQKAGYAGMPHQGGVGPSGVPSGEP